MVHTVRQEIRVNTNLGSSVGINGGGVEEFMKCAVLNNGIDNTNITITKP